jgi:ABC-type sulfate/molybdate transport systems ATPase subunit
LETFKKDFTIIMVSHDLATAKAHGDWIICLNRTVIAEGSPKKIFRPSILSKAFGIHQSVLFGEDFPEDNETSVDNQILKDEKADKEELNIDKTKGAEVTLTEGKNKGTNCCSCGENHRV